MTVKDFVADFLKRHWIILVFVIAFLIGSYLFIFHWYNYQLNPDAVSYFTIAQKYADFDFKHAINGYWGPLFSWLLVPAVWLDLNLILAAKLLIALLAVAMMGVIYWFLLSRKIDQVLSALAAGLVGSSLLLFVAFPVSPDLLLGLFMLLFAVLFIEFIQKPSRWLAVVIGAVGALMFFSKAFGFYLFLAITGAVALWQWWQSGRSLKPIVKRFLPMVLVFAVLVLPWIGIISVKYNGLTISTVGEFDHNMFGPVAKGVDYPMQSQGPLAPPNNAATSVWEDPTLLIPLIPGAGWSPLGSEKEFQYLTNSIIGHNLDASSKIIVGFGPVAALGALVLVLYAFKRKFAYRGEYGFLLLITTTVVLAYSLILVEARFFSAVLAFCVIAAALWAATLIRGKVISYGQVVAAGLIVLALSLVVNLQEVAKYRDINEFESVASEILRPVLPKGANIVSDTFDSYYMCYQLKLHCYSILNPPAGGTQVEYYELLKKLGVQYYVDYGWVNSDVRNEFVGKYFTLVHEQPLQATTFRVYTLN